MATHASDYKLRRLLGCEDEREVRLNTRFVRCNLIHQNVLKHLREAKYERQYNIRTRPRQLKVGKKGFVRTYTISDATRPFSAKLAPKFTSTTIIARIGIVAYRLQGPTGRLLGTYHAKYIRN